MPDVQFTVHLPELHPNNFKSGSFYFCQILMIHQVYATQSSTSSPQIETFISSKFFNMLKYISCSTDDFLIKLTSSNDA